MKNQEKISSGEVGPKTGPLPSLHPLPGSVWIFSATSSAYERHNGPVEIVRELRSGGDEVDDEVGPMFKCRSPKGEFDAFGDELSPNNEVRDHDGTSEK